MPLLNLRNENNILVVSLTTTKILDEATIEQIGSEMIASIPKAPDEKIVVNFGRVTFMSSAMIGKLILFNNACKKGNIKLKLCAISDNIMEVFKIMGLNKIFDIQKTEESAILSYEKKRLFG